MIRIDANDKVLEVVRLILEQPNQDVFFTDRSLQTARKLSCDRVLDLFAAGFPAQYDVKSMSAIMPSITSGALPSDSQNMFEASLRWFISIFDSLHDGVLVADQNEVVRYINKSFERISGARFPEVVGRILSQARPGAKLGKVIRSGKPMLGVRRKFGDIEYMTDMHPIFINGQCMGGITIARDITEIQQLQTKLSKYRVRYNDLLRQINKEQASHTFADILGNGPALNVAKRLAEKLAPSMLPVLLRGESGTGKELFAHAIHLSSPRRDQAFITVNCAAIPGPLLESELFGYRAGAFSGAKQGGKTGLITLAHNGTLFLDEIGDLDIELQAKLLRVLQTGEVQPVGSLTKEKVDIRIIAATNVNLEKMIERGKFREDLYYRLNVSQIYVPPLRERREDIALLANQFLVNCSHNSNLGKLQLAPETLAILEHYSWPGNVRELENTIRFIANITERPIITPDYLPQVFFQSTPAADTHPHSQEARSVQLEPTLQESKIAAEKLAILSALDKCGRSVSGKREAAKQLGISLTTLYSRMNHYHIK